MIITQRVIGLLRKTEKILKRGTPELENMSKDEKKEFVTNTVETLIVDLNKMMDKFTKGE